MRASAAPEVIAPDGSEVRVLVQGERAGMALFTLQPGEVSKAVAHRTIEEVWYFISGHGRFWHADDSGEGVEPVEPGVSLVIPPGTRFQFRCDGTEPLTAVGVNVPPWPGADEAYYVAGIWE